MLAMRRWAIRHAGALERTYLAFRAILRGLHERCFILFGVGPVVSLKAAHWLRRRVPGVHAMAPRHYDLVAEVVAGSGVLAGRTALFAGTTTGGVTR
jgi:hypothetical protein